MRCGRACSIPLVGPFVTTTLLLRSLFVSRRKGGGDGFDEKSNQLGASIRSVSLHLYVQRELWIQCSSESRQTVVGSFFSGNKREREIKPVWSHTRRRLQLESASARFVACRYFFLDFAWLLFSVEVMYATPIIRFPTSLHSEGESDENTLHHCRRTCIT